ncbi:MAG: catalase [Clostridia bacterium]|nr:catalase [Clostridia bacterium]
MGHAIKHFKTITRHRHEVIKNCARAGILWQGLRHDLSKYSPAEFVSGAKYYIGTKSPNECERAEIGYSKAWLHHKGRNKHHFEYWTDYNAVKRKVEPVEMPLNYVAEMFCDRVAASKIYNGKNYNDNCALDYFIRGKANRFIHPNTSDLLEKLLTMLSQKGEEETFRYLKGLVKEYKKERKGNK